MHQIFKKMAAPIIMTTVLLGTIWTTPVLAEETPMSNLVKEFSSLKFSELSKDPAKRLGGNDRYETAVKISQEGWAAGSSDYAILSAGMNDNLVDSLTAAPLAHFKKAPILLTEGDALNPFAGQELQRLGVKTVYVTSGTGVIKQPVLDKLNKMNIQIVPLGGLDRFETALNIAKELGSFDQVIVSTAYNNADALSAAAIAANQGIPIVLSNAAQIPQNVSDYLSTKQIKQSYVLGGTGALSSAVEQSLPNPTRLGGADRFETNVKIIEAFSGVIQGTKLYVASGNDLNLVDALAGSSLAAQTASAIVLIDNQKLPVGTRDFIKKNIFPLVPADLVALGGISIVPNQVLEDMSFTAIYAQDGMSAGSSQDKTPENINDNVVVNGNQVTVNGLNTPYNVYVEGNNITLKNVTAGALILNPGAQGAVRLENVQAENVLVLSGAPDGIQIADSKFKLLVAESSSQVGLTVTGTTSIENTVASSAAALDASGGSFGRIIISKLANTEPNIVLQGDFDQEIAIMDGVVTNESPTRIQTLYVIPKTTGQNIEIKGNYGLVIVAVPAKLTFNEGSATKIIANTEADLTAVSASIAEGITRQ